MIKYTQFTASQEVPPPYHFPNATVHAFIWEPDLKAVQRYCDDTFNNLQNSEHRQFVYRPASFWPYANLLFIDYPEMIAEADTPAGETPYQDRGFVHQQEVFVALPIVRYGATPEKFLYQTNLEWALPFIVVDNPMSATCGREMLGLGKLLADIKIGKGAYPDSFDGRVELPGWASDPCDDEQKPLPFLEVSTGPSLPTSLGRKRGRRATPPWQSLWSLFQSREAGWAFDSLVSAVNIADDLTVGLAPSVMRTVSLRQIRNAAKPQEAVYQALVSCRTHYDNVREFSFFNEQDVEITFHDTGSFAQALRPFLADGSPRSFKPKAAYQFKADIDFDQMQTIFTYTKNGEKFDLAPAAGDLTSPWLRPLQAFFSPRP